MAASTAGALKALVEGAGLSLAAYRDLAPERATLPYVVVNEAIAIVPTASSARFDRAGTAPTGRETAQVSLWQRWRNPETGAMAESYTLPDALIELLDGAQLSAAPSHVWGVLVLSSRRIIEQEENLVQHAITVEIVRDI